MNEIIEKLEEIRNDLADFLGSTIDDDDPQKMTILHPLFWSIDSALIQIENGDKNNG